MRHPAARAGWVALGLAATTAVAASGERVAPAWPDSVLARTQVLALVETLNADLLSHASATLTLERWCGAHHLASPAKVTARRVRGQDKPLPPAMRTALGLAPDTPVKYRRVQLMCGGHVLSEADNWYRPDRLTAAMNRTLDATDAPFGKVVRPLHFRRQTLSAQLLWTPLPGGWEMRRLSSIASGGALAIPHRLLQHHALLYDGQGRPFSALVETYTDQVLAFPAPPPPVAVE